MKLKAKMLASCLAGLGFIACGNVASAATFTYSSYGVTNEQNISITNPNAVNGGMGQIILNGTGTNPTGGALGPTLAVWCLDIYDWLQGSGTYNVTTFTSGYPGASNPTTVNLSSTQTQEIAGLMAYGDSHISTYDVSAATQMAIWQIEYTGIIGGIGSGFQFSSPSASSSVALLATDLYNQVTSSNGGTVGLGLSFDLLSGDTNNQDLGFVGQNGSLTTPLPAALPLFATGLGVIGLFGRRRKRKTSAIAA